MPRTLPPGPTVPQPVTLDVWGAARAVVPDTDDHTLRHRSGHVRLPWDVGDKPGRLAGDLIAAWVCCDPACAGVELGEHVLDINHGCCALPRFVGQRDTSRGRHRTGLGTVYFTGAYHGPFTPHWQPEAVR